MGARNAFMVPVLTLVLGPPLEPLFRASLAKTETGG